MEEDKKKTHKVIAVGNDMIELIEAVGEKFKEEYGFAPQQIEITNIIAKRVVENKLF